MKTMENKGTLTVMIGLMGSGKSTFAKKYLAHGAKIHSTDDIRLELFSTYDCMDKHSEVFAELHKRVRENLKQGLHVVVDATSLTMKSRRKLFNGISLPMDSYRRQAVIMATPLQVCLEQNRNRSRKVPEQVIIDARGKFQMPMDFEFDSIVVIHHDSLRDSHVSNDSYENLLSLSRSFNQENPHHSLTLDMHMLKAFISNRGKSHVRKACYMHDLGKSLCQTFDENKVAHYFGHENIGAYELLIALKDKEQYKDVIRIVQLVNYHMMPYSWKDEKTHEKYKIRFGEEFYDELMEVHVSDVKAH